jgi:AcrR family transcriptional regulator
MPKKANSDSAPSGSTRERILASARELFAAHGFKGTTTAAIARHAGVNEALIFRHFPGKKDLYTAILRAKLEDERTTRVIGAAECQKISAEEALRLVAERFAESADPVFLRLYYHAALENHELADEFYRHFISRLITLVQELIVRGVREGHFREVDTLAAAHAFTGMLRSHCVTKELFPGHQIHLSNLEVADAFCDLFLQSIRKV